MTRSGDYSWASLRTVHAERGTFPPAELQARSSSLPSRIAPSNHIASRNLQVCNIP